MKPSIASVMLPLILAIATVAIGDWGAVVPLAVLLTAAIAIKAAIRMKAMATWKAAAATIGIWFSVFLVEQKMRPELASYRAAGGSVFAGVSLIPYVGPLLNFVGNIEQVRRNNSPNRIRFGSQSNMVEKFSPAAMGLMFAFCFGALRLDIRSSKLKAVTTP